MSDTATAAKKTTKAKKPAAPRSHPAFSDMIVAAVTALKERKGSSSPAIKKYILANYKVDEKKVATYVKVALKKLVLKGALKQIKASYKLAEKPAAKAKKPAAKKVKKPVAKKAAKSPKKAATKKAAAKKPAAKKAAAAKPKKVAKKPAKAAKKPVAKKPAKKAPAKKAAKK